MANYLIGSDFLLACFAPEQVWPVPVWSSFPFSQPRTVHSQLSLFNFLITKRLNWQRPRSSNCTLTLQITKIQTTQSPLDLLYIRVTWLVFKSIDLKHKVALVTPQHLSVAGSKGSGGSSKAGTLSCLWSPLAPVLKGSWQIAPVMPVTWPLPEGINSMLHVRAISLTQTETILPSRFSWTCLEACRTKKC